MSRVSGDLRLNIRLPESLRSVQPPRAKVAPQLTCLGRPTINALYEAQLRRDNEHRVESSRRPTSGSETVTAAGVQIGHPTGVCYQCKPSHLAIVYAPVCHKVCPCRRGLHSKK